MEQPGDYGRGGFFVPASTALRFLPAIDLLALEDGFDVVALSAVIFLPPSSLLCPSLSPLFVKGALRLCLVSFSRRARKKKHVQSSEGSKKKNTSQSSFQVFFFFRSLPLSGECCYACSRPFSTAAGSHIGVLFAQSLHLFFFLTDFNLLPAT